MVVEIQERGIDTTSKVEGLWGDIKSIIKKIYVSIPSVYLIYFIKESEFRREIRNLSWLEKLKEFSIFIYTLFNGNGINYDLLSEDDLLSLDYDTYF